MSKQNAMFEWYDVRLVRSRKRAKKLAKRGNLVFWDSHNNCYGWKPGYDYVLEFKCPLCGGDHFGTRGPEREVGCCHGSLNGLSCGYRWDRKTEDEKVFHHQLVRVPKHLRHAPTPEERGKFEKLQKEMRKKNQHLLY